jgi:RNA polymerase sigma-70 factor (ECF subfamily)
LALYTEIAPALAAWTHVRLWASLKDRVPAEDFLQEVWCRALAAFDSFDPKLGAFRPWIFGIARNLLLEVMRSHARQRTSKDAAFPLSQVADEATAVSRRACSDELLRKFCHEVTLLDEGDRDLLLWRGLEGLPHEDVAERLGVGREAAMKRWQRLRDRLASLVPEGQLLLD